MSSNFNIRNFNKLGLVRNPLKDSSFSVTDEDGNSDEVFFKAFQKDSLYVYYAKYHSLYTIKFKIDSKYEKEDYINRKWFEETTKFINVESISLPQLEASINLILNGIQELDKEIKDYTPDYEYIEKTVEEEKKKALQAVERFKKDFKWWDNSNIIVYSASLTIKNIEKSINKPFKYKDKHELRRLEVRNKNNNSFFQVELEENIKTLSIILSNQRTCDEIVKYIKQE